MQIAPGKNPNKVRAGRIGASTRWGPVRVVRLDGLTPEDRLTIVSLVETLRKRGEAA